MGDKEMKELTDQTINWLNILKDGTDSEKLQVIGEALAGIHIYAYNMDDNISLIRDLIAKKMRETGE